MTYFEFTADEKTYLRDTLAAEDAALSVYATHNRDALRRYTSWYKPFSDAPDNYLVRPPFLVDVDKVLNNPFFNRCADKTQVFSLYHNDDITRRAYHLQLVSRIARTIGRALRLNLDLIEAIALAHDAGHTPFGHEGERFLSDIHYQHTGRYFNHNVHSVRLLKDVAHCNLTLQTYDGMLCHCGEKAFEEYHPGTLSSFDELDQMVERCYVSQEYIDTLHPSTLEGCVVRISDILAYVGKDRQDAVRLARLVGANAAPEFDDDNIVGATNAEIIENTTRNIIKNSIGKGYLSMDDEVSASLDALREENYEKIYRSDEAKDVLNNVIRPMMHQLYRRLLDDLKAGDEISPIFKHHVHDPIMGKHFADMTAEDVVCDYLASLTDDYFIALFAHLFPEDPKTDQIHYHPYF